VVVASELGDEIVDESVGTFGGRLRGIVVIALVGVVVCKLIDGMVSMQIDGIVGALSDILVGTLAGAVMVRWSSRISWDDFRFHLHESLKQLVASGSFRKHRDISSRDISSRDISSFLAEGRKATFKLYCRHG
jgi:hypothetical protein